MDFSLRRKLLLLTMLLGLGACSNGKILLDYRFDEGDGTSYVWTIDSRTSVSSTSEQSVTETNMVVNVHERVTDGEDGDAILTILLTPKVVRQNGRGMRIPEPVTVRYQLGPNGEISKPVADDLQPQAASALELGANLIHSRVALPPEPVGIGDQWETPLVLDGDLGNIALEGNGKLLGFELRDKRKLARIETRRSGEIITHQQQGGVPVRLRGTSTTNSMSRLDIDNGVLYASTARSESEFDIASHESGKLIGSMRVVLDSRLELNPDPVPAGRPEANRRSPGR